LKDIKDFKAGTWLRQLEYKSFSPNPILEEWVASDPELLTLLSEADRKG